MQTHKCVVLTALLAIVLSSLSFAASPDRITGKVDSTNMVELKNHVAVMAQSQFDQGPVDGSQMLHVTMLFTPSAQQQQALEELIAQQQNPKSPHFHQWLTSEQFGQQFGLSQNDIGKISSWLESQGLKVSYVAHGRDFLKFDGSVAQVQSVFRTSIHNYNVKGKTHFANVTPPMIPAALSGIVGGFRGLHNFFPHPMLKQHPNYTVTTNQGSFTVLAPADIATIYDLGPLYTKSPAINGTGQSVVIAGQSDVYIADINYFRSAFGYTGLSGCTLDSQTNTILQAGTCSSGNFQVVWPDGVDPGIVAGDVSESDLDIEWLSSVAPGAQIVFVTSGESGGVDDSVSWAVDQNPVLGKVISYSYGLCEAFVTAPSISTAEQTYQKAVSEGISMFAASGDAAAATCDGDDGYYPAQLGASVSYPASSPNVTGVGGTEFDENRGTNGPYWNASNGTNGESAVSYIPEIGWNDSGLSSQDLLDGSGGGASNCASGTGTTEYTGSDGFTYPFELCDAPPNGGFVKPTWQTGAGVPADGVRDVPDIAFSASNFNDPYIVCVPQSETNGSSSASTCTPTSGTSPDINNALLTYNSAFGGTSASTPLTAGMTALLNQYLGSDGLGLINPQLYKLFAANPTGVFNVIGTGASETITGANSDNVVACVDGDPSFEVAALRCSSGTFGFTVGGGHTYSQVTGLGSVDINAFINAWAASRTATTTTISPSSSTIGVGGSVTFTATVTPSTATGTVSFVDTTSNTTLGSGTLSSGTATYTTTSLPTGANNVTAVYNGDGYNSTSTSTATTVTVGGFSVSATSASVTAGHTISVTVTVTPVSGYTVGTVTLQCATPPAGITGCAFTPSTLPPNNGSPSTSTLTISTAPDMALGLIQVPYMASAPVMINSTSSNVMINANASITVGQTDETISLTSSLSNGTLQVAQGANSSITLTVSGTNGFITGTASNQTTIVPVTYSCSGYPSESTCAGPSQTSTTATSITFQLTTTAPTAKLNHPFSRGSRVFYAVFLPLGLLFMVGSRKHSLRGVRFLALIVALGFSTLWMGACSGSTNASSKNPGTPVGNYTITINAQTTGVNPLKTSTSFTLSVVQ